MKRTVSCSTPWWLAKLRAAVKGTAGAGGHRARPPCGRGWSPRVRRPGMVGRVRGFGPARRAAGPEGVRREMSGVRGAVEIANVTKRFGSVIAVDDVTI